MYNNIINNVSLNYSLPCNCCKQPVFSNNFTSRITWLRSSAVTRGNAKDYIRSILVWEISAAETQYENISPPVFQDCIAITYYVLRDVCTIFIGPPELDFLILITRARRTLTNVKMKLNVSLYTLRRHVGRVEKQLHSLPLGTRRKWVVSFTSRPLQSSSIHWIEGGAAGAGLDVERRDKSLAHSWIRTPDFSDRSQHDKNGGHNKHLYSSVLFKVTLNLST